MGASGGAAVFRIALMPVDALKTTLQVEGAAGMSVLGNKIRAGGPFVLWHGAIAASSATFVGHYPWFVTRNYMEVRLLCLPSAPVLWDVTRSPSGIDACAYDRVCVWLWLVVFAGVLVECFEELEVCRSCCLCMMTCQGSCCELHALDSSPVQCPTPAQTPSVSSRQPSKLPRKLSHIPRRSRYVPLIITFYVLAPGNHDQGLCEFCHIHTVEKGSSYSFSLCVLQPGRWNSAVNPPCLCRWC